MEDHKNRKDVLWLLQRVPFEVLVEEYIAHVWRISDRKRVPGVYAAHTVLKNVVPRLEDEFGIGYVDKSREFYKIT